MNDAKEKGGRRPRGAFGLWLAVAVLALVYLGVWSADRSTGRLPQEPASASVAPMTLPSATTEALGEAAKQDAAVRVSGSQVEVATVQPTYFTTGAQLKPSSPGVGQLGVTVTLKSLKDGKVADELTYYAVPPNRVEFVGQKAAQ